MTFQKLVDAVQAITGWDVSLFEIMKASERSLVLSRMFNIREGFGRDDDKVIRRWYEKIPAGPLAGQKMTSGNFERRLIYTMKCGLGQKRGSDPREARRPGIGMASGRC